MRGSCRNIKSLDPKSLVISSFFFLSSLHYLSVSQVPFLVRLLPSSLNSLDLSSLSRTWSLACSLSSSFALAAFTICPYSLLHLLSQFIICARYFHHLSSPFTICFHHLPLTLAYVFNMGYHCADLCLLETTIYERFVSTFTANYQTLETIINQYLDQTISYLPLPLPTLPPCL